MSRNTDLLQRSLAAVWHPCTQMQQHAAAVDVLPLLPIERAEGVWLYDFDGRRLFDGISSWWVNLLGHGHPAVNAAIREQLQTLEHVMLAGFTHEPVVQLSEQLAQLAPGKLGHCFYGSDGASAIEIALKMSFHYWRNQGHTDKTRFLALRNSYHGETLGALSVTDIPLFRSTYAELLRAVDQVPSPDWRLADPGESAEDYALRCAATLEAHLQQHAAQTAAFIVEPLVQCAGGMAMYHAAYLRRAAALCRQYEVHLIADEIAVGFGRTGSMFACEQADVAPDFLCLSKGITGGYLPLSVVMTTDAVYAAFYDPSLSRGFLHSHSYTGNPLACRAALAVLSVLTGEQRIARNIGLRDWMNRRIASWHAHPGITQLRNTGMIWAFELTDTRADAGARFHRQALQQGILLRPIGRTVYWMPPYAVDEETLEFLAAGIERVLDAG